MANIVKRRGAFYLDFRDATGARKQLRFRTRQDAEDAFKTEVPGPEARSTRQHQKRRGVNPRVTLGEWGAKFLRDMAPPALKPRAWDAHADAFRRFIEPALGEVRVIDLRRPDLRDFLLDVQKTGRAPCHRRDCVAQRAEHPWLRCPHAAVPLAPGSVRIVYSALRAILQLAVEDDILSGNPAARLGRSRGLRLEPTTRERQQRVEARVPEADEVTQLLAYTQRRAKGWYPVVLTIARAGLRLGEIAGLQVEDFNPHAPSLHVRQAVNKKTLALEPPKHGPRVVDLSPSPELVRMLRAHVAGLRKHALKTGTPVAPWMFPTTRTGRPLQPRNLARAVTDLCRKAGLGRPHSPHDFRHAFATRLVEKGAPLDYVQRQLGHASIQLTIDTYARTAKTKLPAHLVGILDDGHATLDDAAEGRG